MSLCNCEICNIYRMIRDQNPERRSEPRLEDDLYNRPTEDTCSKPATSFDWELLQAMNHLTTAISCTDDVRAMQLTAALNIVNGVSADD